MTVFRRDGSISTTQGVAISGANVYVCTQPVSTSLGPPPTIPPAPLATIWADPNGTIPLTNPFPTDALGNGFFYAATGIYTIIIDDPEGRIADLVFPDQEVVSPGGGSVTSVAMTGDGVVFQSSVPGSPITAGGTLAPANRK